MVRCLDETKGKFFWQPSVFPGRYTWGAGLSQRNSLELLETMLAFVQVS